MNSSDEQPPPEDAWFYEVVPLRRLPRVRGLRGPPCMIGFGRGVLRRLGVRPRHRPGEVCRYHGVDWAVASAIAVRVVRQTQVLGLCGEALDARLRTALSEDDAIEDEAVRKAASSLVVSGVAIEVVDRGWGRRSFNEGRHRVIAMRDAGVRETVLLRYPKLDPV